MVHSFKKVCPELNAQFIFVGHGYTTPSNYALLTDQKYLFVNGCNWKTDAAVRLVTTAQRNVRLVVFWSQVNLLSKAS